MGHVTHGDGEMWRRKETWVEWESELKKGGGTILWEWVRKVSPQSQIRNEGLRQVGKGLQANWGHRWIHPTSSLWANLNAPSL